MKILVIAGDAGFAEILSDCITKDRELAVEAVLSSEQEAMDYIRSGRIAAVDCILLDWQLPRSRADRTTSIVIGLNVAFEIKRRLGFWGKIIVLASSWTARDGERASVARCDGYICKRTRKEDVPIIVREMKAAIAGDNSLTMQKSAVRTSGRWRKRTDQAPV